MTGMTAGRRALVLGGTRFLGVHLVEALLREGWDVSTFTRGRTNPDLFPQVTALHGDRDDDVGALTDGEWDVVHDLTAYHPAQVHRTAEALVGRVGHYVLVSSVSVYADVREPGVTEDAPVATIDGPVPDAFDMELYGPLKALCERAVAERFPGSTVVRPSIIAGPHDPTDRFTAWVVRMSEPGPHITPPLDAPVQWVDARDLADWLVRLGADRTAGTFNAATPAVPFEVLLRTVADEAGVAFEPVVLSDEQRAAEGVRAWADLPLWLDDPSMRGLLDVDITRALAAGLRARPLAATVRDTLAWVRARGSDERRSDERRPDERRPDEQPTDDLRAGLTRARDAELAARYGA